MAIDTARKDMKQSIRAYGIPFVLEIVAELCREGKKAWEWDRAHSEQWGDCAAAVEQARAVLNGYRTGSLTEAQG